MYFPGNDRIMSLYFVNGHNREIHQGESRRGVSIPSEKVDGTPDVSGLVPACPGWDLVLGI